MATPLKAASKGYAGAARELARWSAASQMPGGSKAKGSPGLAKSLSKTAGQLKEGQLKGAAGTMLNYGGGKLGTLGNRMKMAAEGAFRDQYYQKMADAHRARELRKSSQAWSEMYKKQKDNPEYAEAIADHLDTMTKDGQIKDHIKNAKRRDPITVNHDDDKN